MSTMDTVLSRYDAENDAGRVTWADAHMAQAIAQLQYRVAVLEASDDGHYEASSTPAEELRVEVGILKRNLDKVAAQRAELLAALKMAREHFASYGSQDREEDNQLMDILQAAIKKAEEK
jgi:hypothetical protein